MAKKPVTKVTEGSPLSPEQIEELKARLQDGATPVDDVEPLQMHPVEDADSDPSDEEHQGEEDNRDLDVFFIDRLNCVRCLHLFPSAPEDKFKAFDKCHYSQGNVNCPASHARIVIGMNIDEAVSQYQTALTSGDAATIQELMSDIHERDPYVQDLVFSAIRNSMSK